MTEGVAQWDDQPVPAGLDFSINVDLFAALAEVLGYEPSEPEPVVVVAQYIYALAKDYGLSDSQHLTGSHLDAIAPPAATADLIAHYLSNFELVVGANPLRDRLYEVICEVAADADARQALSKGLMSEDAFLKIAQVGWNLEWSESRSALPIKPGTIRAGGSMMQADIPISRSNQGRPPVAKDAARLTWTERTNHGVDGLGDGRAAQSSGPALRTKLAIIAALIARRFVARQAQQQPMLDGARLHVVRPEGGKAKASIEWTEFPLTESVVRAHSPGSLRHQVIVGRGADLSAGYQPRGFDLEIDRLWADGGDRRVWVRGGPGLGKSYSARRIWQEALAAEGDDALDLLIWVDSADEAATNAAFSKATDAMPELGIAFGGQDPPIPHLPRAEHRATAIAVPTEPALSSLTLPSPTIDDRISSAEVAGREQPRKSPIELQRLKVDALLAALESRSLRWLVVLDNADPASLIEAALLPTGRNPNGRVVLTTVSRDQRIAHHGRIVEATTFDGDEATGYLRRSIDPSTGRESGVAMASDTDLHELATVLGNHPLGLACASATIIQTGMDVTDWIAEFGQYSVDEAADVPDGGGYPTKIGATWRVALERASRGLPQGLAARAAAVAALLDPDGHPTWIWSQEPILMWVAGGQNLDRRSGRPPIVLQRLIEHGIVELDGNWKTGQVRIHQLAARSIRELLPGAELSELGGLLLDALLLHIVTAELNPYPSLRGNAQALSASGVLPTDADETVTALLGLAGAFNAALADDEGVSARFFEEELVECESEYAALLSVREHLSTPDLRFLASAAESCARALEALDRSDEASGYLDEVIRLNRKILADGSSSDGDRSDAYRSLADAAQHTEGEEQARAYRVAAAEIFERRIEAAVGVREVSDLIFELASLNEEIGGAVLGRETRLQYEAKLADIITIAPPKGKHLRAEGVDGQRARIDLYKWSGRREKYVEHQMEAGDRVGAMRSYRALASAWRKTGYPSRARRYELDIARIEVASAEMAAAERTLLRTVAGHSGKASGELADDLVRLSSVQLHCGNSAEALANLARAAQTFVQPKRTKRPKKIESSAGRLSATDSLHVIAFRATKQNEWARARVLVSRLTELDPGEHEDWLAICAFNEGVTLGEDGRHQRAIEPLASAVNLFQLRADLQPEDDFAQRTLVRALYLLGSAQLQSGEVNAATETFGQALAIAHATQRASGEDTETRSIYWLVRTSLTRALAAADRLDEARGHYQAVLDDKRSLVGGEAPDLDAAKSLAASLGGFGDLLGKYGDIDAAEPLWHEQIAILSGLVVSSTRGSEQRDELADAFMRIGMTVAHDLPEKSLEYFERALEQYRYDSLEGSLDGAVNTALAHHYYAGALQQLGRLEDAATHLEAGIELLRRRTESVPEDRDAHVWLAGFIAERAAELSDDGRVEDVPALLDQSANTLRMVHSIAPDNRDAILYKMLRAVEGALRQAGLTHDADDLEERASDLLRRFPDLDEGH